MEIAVTRLGDAATLPSYAHAGDAGCDLVSIGHYSLRARGGRAVVETGLCLAIPEGYGGLVLPRSGLATRHGVTCANAPGLIDAGYRGEVRVVLVNLDPDADYEVSPGDRIAQLVIVAVASATFREVDELPSSSRGTGGFGSSGT